MPIPRDERDHNPLNIRRDGTDWEGLAPQQPDPDFCSFTSDVFGFRAAFRILITYADKYKIDTVNALINRWAPPSENDTAAYIAKVCKRTGFAPTETLAIKTWAVSRKLIYAMTEVESGALFEQNFKPNDLAEGAFRAGIADAPKTPVRKVAVIATAAGSAALSGAPDALVWWNSTFTPLVSAANLPAIAHWCTIGAVALAALAAINHVLSSKGKPS